MTNEILLFTMGVSIGIALGSYWTWYWAIRSEKPVVHVTVDRDLLSITSQLMVMAWLEERGLTWQAKGAVFDPERVIRK
jgi:drug/metabolite transporter superfamily protein YnfA